MISFSGGSHGRSRNAMPQGVFSAKKLLSFGVDFGSGLTSCSRMYPECVHLRKATAPPLEPSQQPLLPPLPTSDGRQYAGKRTPATHPNNAPNNAPNNIPSNAPQPTPHIYMHVYLYVQANIKYVFGSGQRCRCGSMFGELMSNVSRGELSRIAAAAMPLHSSRY